MQKMSENLYCCATSKYLFRYKQKPATQTSQNDKTKYSVDHPAVDNCRIINVFLAKDFIYGYYRDMAKLFGARAFCGFSFSVHKEFQDRNYSNRDLSSAVCFCHIKPDA